VRGWSADRLERELVRALPLAIPFARGLQGRGLRKLWQLFQLLAASLKVRQLIRVKASTWVLQHGGAYIAAPAILAAALVGGVPVVPA